MDITQFDKAILRKLWSDETSRIALKKLIVNSLGGTLVQVKELENVWSYINTELEIKEVNELKKGSDETV